MVLVEVMLWEQIEREEILLKAGNVKLKLKLLVDYMIINYFN